MKQRSYISARNMKPLDYSKIGQDGLDLVGINIPEKYLGTMMSAMDSLEPSITSGSITTPIQFLQAWMPGFVKIVTASRKIDDLVGIQTIGSWEDEEVVQGSMELSGTSVPYGDYTNIPYSSWNTNFERRSIIRFEEGMRIGSLEEARAAKMRVNAADAKRESSALALEIQRNRIGFYGYNNGSNRTYGFLNDPALSAYSSVASGVGGVHWYQKTFLEITADLREMASSLRTQSGDIIDVASTETTLAIATAAVDYLTTTSEFGISVYDWISKTFNGKMRIISAPELNGANGGANAIYLYADKVDDTSTDGGMVFAQMVPTKFQVIGVQKLAKGYEEDYSNATAGVMLKRPWAVIRRSGI